MKWFGSLLGKARAEGRVIEHPDLGSLVSDGEGHWTGKQVVDGYPIEFRIDGTDDIVREEIAEYCSQILTKFHLYLEQALELISSSESITVAQAKAQFRPSLLFSIDKAGDGTFFYMGFIDSKDEFKLWRVQFENEVATYAGFDT